ncbi:MAG: HigA family addiction module antitoxin [Treponema sp.]
MAQKTNGLSREMIIHPGETLKEVLEDRGMPQLELAQRTGMSPKHISTVINGEKDISVAFARKLAYALGIEAAFWINLQTNYDKEILEYEDLNSISEEEATVAKSLKEVNTYLTTQKLLSVVSGIPAKIIELRKLLGVSNLMNIRTLTYNGAYRAQLSVSIIPEVLFAWQRICELETEKIEVTEQEDTEQKKKLRELLPQIKNCMFSAQNNCMRKLSSLFASCGIAFAVIPAFAGAPVQGFLKRTEQGKTLLCMTLRKKRADIFWFTLFHEIGHVLNGDGRQRFIDFESEPGEIETKADTFAENQLLDKDAYAAFVKSADYSETAINQFAKKQQVLPFIVIGRLQKDGKLRWSDMAEEIVWYERNVSR